MATVADLLDRADSARAAGRTEVAAGLYDQAITRCRETGDLPGWTRIVLTWSWVAAEPKPADPPQDGSVVTIALRAAGPGATELTLTHSRLGGPPDEGPVGIAEAWSQALRKLEDIV